MEKFLPNPGKVSKVLCSQWNAYAHYTLEAVGNHLMALMEDPSSHETDLPEVRKES